MKVRSTWPVFANLWTGFCFCLAATSLWAQLVVFGGTNGAVSFSTNFNGGSGFSTSILFTSGDLANFRGSAVAASGMAGGVVSIAGASLQSETGGAQEGATLETGTSG